MSVESSEVPFLLWPHPPPALKACELLEGGPRQPRIMEAGSLPTKSTGEQEPDGHGQAECLQPEKGGWVTSAPKLQDLLRTLSRGVASVLGENMRMSPFG